MRTDKKSTDRRLYSIFNFCRLPISYFHHVIWDRPGASPILNWVRPLLINQQLHGFCFRNASPGLIPIGTKIRQDRARVTRWTWHVITIHLDMQIHRDIYALEPTRLDPENRGSSRVRRSTNRRSLGNKHRRSRVEVRMQSTVNWLIDCYSKWWLLLVEYICI